MQLEIITGVSIFNTDLPIVGLALKGESNTINLCTTAEKLAGNRPAATQTLNGRTEGEQIAYLVQQWRTWATKNNLSLTINTRPRWVCAL